MARARRGDAGRGPPRLALVGAGPWGRRYIATLRGHAGARLAVVASRNPRTPELVPEGCTVVRRWEDALAAPVDGVVLATPPALHGAMAAACIERRLPVLVEKPFTLSASEARELADAARAAGTPVMVGHVHLYSAAYSVLRERVRAGGPVRALRSAGANRGPFRDDCDALWDYGPHDLAMCLDLLGSDPVAIRARRRAGEPRRRGGPAGPGELFDLDLEFPAGARARITVGNGAATRRRWLEVETAEVRLRYDDLAGARLTGSRGRGTAAPIPLPPGRPLERELDHFCRLVRGGEPSDPGLALAVRVTSVLEAASAAL